MNIGSNNAGILPVNILISITKTGKGKIVANVSLNITFST